MSRRAKLIGLLRQRRSRHRISGIQAPILDDIRSAQQVTVVQTVTCTDEKKVDYTLTVRNSSHVRHATEERWISLDLCNEARHSENPTHDERIRLFKNANCLL